MRSLSGWWWSHPSENYEFVSWDDYSQYIEKQKNVPNHQPVIFFSPTFMAGHLLCIKSTNILDIRRKVWRVMPSCPLKWLGLAANRPSSPVGKPSPLFSQSLRPCPAYLGKVQWMILPNLSIMNPRATCHRFGRSRWSWMVLLGNQSILLR